MITVETSNGVTIKQIFYTTNQKNMKRKYFIAVIIYTHTNQMFSNERYEREIDV